MKPKARKTLPGPPPGYAFPYPLHLTVRRPANPDAMPEAPGDSGFFEHTARTLEPGTPLSEADAEHLATPPETPLAEQLEDAAARLADPAKSDGLAEALYSLARAVPSDGERKGAARLAARLAQMVADLREPAYDLPPWAKDRQPRAARDVAWLARMTIRVANGSPPPEWTDAIATAFEAGRAVGELSLLPYEPDARRGRATGPNAAKLAGDKSARAGAALWERRKAWLAGYLARNPGADLTAAAVAYCRANLCDKASAEAVRKQWYRRQSKA